MNTSIDTGVNTDTSMDIDNTSTSMNEANEKEKNWWSGKGFSGTPEVDEERDVKFNKFAKRVGKSRRFFDYQDDTVAIIELPTPEHEVVRSKLGFMFMKAFNNVSIQDDISNWGAASLYTNLPSDEYEEPDACFVPHRLLENPAPNPCDRDGRPWPTIILEVASSETLQHVKSKLNRHWLAPNRCEDVIIIKLYDWSGRHHNNQTGRPLRRLQCLKFCRAATLRQNPNATTFDPIEVIDFGSVDANDKENFFCTGPHMKWLTINCSCIYNGCPQLPPLPSFHAVISSTPSHSVFPYPLQTPGVAIDLFDIQQAIFRAMPYVE